MIIIGGGIIGLSIGWQLLREGYAVDLYDANAVGEATSKVAAGMLSPYTEAGFEDGELLQLGTKSLSLYPRFLDELEEDSGIRVTLDKTGSLIAAVDRDDRDFLKRIYDFKKEKGFPVQWLSDDQARECEPLLCPKICSAVWIPDEYQIDNHTLVHALKKAFYQRGGTVHEHCKVTKILRDQSVQLSDGKTIQTNAMILCAGPWSQHLSPEELPLRPMKGQIVTLKMDARYRVQHMIRTPRIYLVPKSDGTLRVGATSEDVGMDDAITAGAIWELLENAWEVIPAIYDMHLERMDVGFRPLTDDHMPIVEKSSIDGLYYATGHGRSGILLAPWTSYHMKEKILCEKKSLLMERNTL